VDLPITLVMWLEDIEFRQPFGENDGH